MLFGWRGALAVTLNAAWDPEQVDPDLKSFVKAFDAIYVFQPLAIQVLCSMTGHLLPLLACHQRLKGSAGPWHGCCRSTHGWMLQTLVCSVIMLLGLSRNPDPFPEFDGSGVMPTRP